MVNWPGVGLFVDAIAVPNKCGLKANGAYVVRPALGDVNQFHWIEKHARLVAGPIIEIGSKQYKAGSSFNYRATFGGVEFIGVDQEPGENVDIVTDLTLEFPQIDAKLQGRRFGTIICLSVLEHCPNPFKMAENITRLAAPEALLFISVPFIWRYHGYPDDYWRFTPSAVRLLFREFRFDEFPTTLSANVPGIVADVEEQRQINAFAVNSLSKNPDAGTLSRYSYVLAPTMINMVGTRGPMPTASSS